MYIVNDSGDVCINLEFVTGFNIHSNCLKICVSFSNPGKLDGKLGVYSSKEKCRRAFSDLIRALDSGCYCYQVLKDSDPSLNTSCIGKKVARQAYSKTNGKTK